MRSEIRDTGQIHILDLICERMGVELIGTRRDAALSAIDAAMLDDGVSSYADYHERLRSQPDVLERLIDGVSIGETYFFREPAQFEFVREHILAEVFSDRGLDTPVHAWSAGCASGEEAYSLAIIFDELGVEPNSKVVGTDISRAAVANARAAAYRRWSLRTLEQDTIDRYFDEDDLTYNLQPRIKQRGLFAQHNLAAGGVPEFLRGGELDFVLLRNVLIYFDPAMCRHIVEEAAKSIRHGGWLITASCDPPVQGIPWLEAVSDRGCVFYRRSKDPVAMVTIPRPAKKTRRRVAATPAAQPAAAAESPPAPPAAAFDEAKACEALQSGDYRSVIEMTDGRRENPKARSFAVRALANVSGSLAAFREAESACKDHPLSSELHYLRGLFLFDLGRNDDAADALRRVVYIDPSLALAHFSLGTILERTGDRVRAKRAFENAYALCAQMSPGDAVPLTDGETAEHLAQVIGRYLQAFDAAEEVRA